MRGRYEGSSSHWHNFVGVAVAVAVAVFVVVKIPLFILDYKLKPRLNKREGKEKRR